MNKEERDLMIELMADMIRQEVSGPLEQLMDRLIAMLIVTRALPAGDFGRQMHEAFAGLPEEERDTRGAALITKYAKLGDALGDKLPGAADIGPGSAKPLPDWFRGLIPGGKA